MNSILANEKAMLQNRIHAAYLLSERLAAYRKTNAIVAAIPNGGVPVGFHLAQILELPLEIVQCMKISHPADRSRCIGSVSMNTACIQPGFRNVPQDYIHRKIMLYQNIMNEKYKFYSDGGVSKSFSGKTVILVDDLLRSGETIQACISGIRSENPSRLIVAVPIAVTEAAAKVAPEADEFISIFTADTSSDAFSCYEDFPKVSDEEVRTLFTRAADNQGFAQRKDAGKKGMPLFNVRSHRHSHS